MSSMHDVTLELSEERLTPAERALVGAAWLAALSPWALLAAWVVSRAQWSVIP